MESCAVVRSSEFENEGRPAAVGKGNNSLIRSFELYLRNVKKAARNTQMSYIRDLEQLDAWLQQNGREDLTSLTASSIEDYLAYLEAEGKSPASAARCIASIRSLCRWMCQTGRLQNDPSEGIHAGKTEKHSPGILTGEEVARLLAQPNCADEKGWRDRAMLELLYATGMRVSELISLDVTDLDLEQGIVRCIGRDKERMIPIYAGAVRTLQEYVRRIRPAMVDPEEPALFVNLSGKRLTRQGFWKILKKYQESAGIETDLTPQVLRNSFAAHLLENGADEKSVNEMLGYADRSRSRVYVLRHDQHLRDVYDQSHPLV